MPARKRQPSKDTAEAESAATYKKLNRKEREIMIEYWRNGGWTYAQITAAFEAGVTEEEYRRAEAAREA